jgi:hypothetical protein
MSYYQFEKQLQEKLGLRYRPQRFLNRVLAITCSNNTTKASDVMLGCDGRYWVVCLSDASRLYRQGYQFATR